MKYTKVYTITEYKNPPQRNYYPTLPIHAISIYDSVYNTCVALMQMKKESDIVYTLTRGNLNHTHCGHTVLLECYYDNGQWVFEEINPYKGD